jgi:hypothetical protein
VIRASSTVRQGVVQLQDLPGHIDVVVIRESEGTVLYYVFRAETLRTRMAAAQPDAVIAEVMRLAEFPPSEAGQLNSVNSAGSVALLGRQVVGVMAAEPDSMRCGGTAAPDQPSPPPTRGGGGHGPSLAQESVTRGPGFAPELTDLTDGADPDADRVQPADQPDSSPGLFRAYPDVNAPARAAGGENFQLSVGFSAEPSPAMQIAGPVVPILVLAGPRPEFVIQVTGFGFTFPDGTQRVLTVDRDEPLSARVEFVVRAEPADVAASRILEVSYEYQGVVVGRTWAQIQIVPVSVAAMAAGEPHLAAVGGNGAVTSLGPGDDGPHLSVDIHSLEGGNELLWTFHCPYPDIARPDKVTTNLHDHSAQTFAVQLMRKIPNIRHEFLIASFHGLGNEISNAMPPEFWTMLEQTWRRVRSGPGEAETGAVPRLQITTTEPWIPWELAWVGRERLSEPDLLLPAGSDGATLGELWEVGRWTMPTKRLPSGDIPASPPPRTVDVAEMAVIIGNYAGTPGIGELPNAVAEGKEIAMTYGAMPLDVSVAVMAALLDRTLQRDGEVFAPTAIHFAGHGKTDLANPQFSGLVLAGGCLLESWVVGGSRAVAEEHPFVFLNACEAGVSGEALLAVGGLVGSFLATGASGFIAPLWEVDDTEAHDIAIEFYRRTFDEGQTVGEAMRAIRSRFRATGGGSATALAYTFYGNPALQLNRSVS